MPLRRGYAFLGSAVLVSACSGGAGSVPGPHGGAGESSVPSAATLPVKITVPLPSGDLSSKRRPAYVSEGTQSLAVFVYGAGTNQPATPTATLNISPSTAGCAQNPAANSITCTLDVDAPLGTVNVTLEAMSGTNGTGNILAQATQSVTVSSGMSAVAFTLQGVLAQIRFSLETPVFSAGTAGTSKLDVNGYDAAGELIVAPGDFATPVTIASDSADVTLSASTAAAPATQITITYGGGTAPYAVHLSGSGGGVAANNVVGSTLYIEPAQSVVFFSGNTYDNLAATYSTNQTTLEPAQSLVELAATSAQLPQPGGVTVLPNGDYAIAAVSSTNTSDCALSVYSANGSLLQTTSYQGGIYSPTDCEVAATPSGALVIGDGGASETSQLETFSVAANGTLTSVSTISLVGAQIPSGQLSDYDHAVNASGEIAVVGQGGDANYYVLVYAANATATVAPSQVIALTEPAGAYSIAGLAIAADGSVAVNWSTSSGSGGSYAVQRFTTGGVLAGSITPAASFTYLSATGLALDAGGEIIVGWSGSSGSAPYTYGQGADVYASGVYGTSVTATRSLPLAFGQGSYVGPVIAPAPAPPSAATVSGDMLAYAPSRAWTYLVTPSGGGTPYYVGTYADPQLVNGDVRLVGFTSATSNPFSGGTPIGDIDFAQSAGWYSVVDFTSVSSGTDGVSAAIPGTPLWVPNSLTLGQTWNPLQDAAFLSHSGVNAQAQVTYVGAVAGMAACPNSPSAGASVQYTLSSQAAGSGAGYGIVDYVPGCGITAVMPNDGGSVVLQSVSTQSGLGQQIVPPGQPPIVAALHKLWQRTFGRPKPPK